MKDFDINPIVSFFYDMNFISCLDVAIVLVIVWVIIGLLAKTRGFQIAKGLLLIYVLGVLGDALNLSIAGELFEIISSLLYISLPVVFQNEIRTALENLGRLGSMKKSNAETVNSIVQIKMAVEKFSKEKTGALIVLQRKTSLDEYAKNGTNIDSKISSDMLECIFENESKLHDGATIIKDNRIFAAKCIMPLTETDEYEDLNIGTRHRAAIGISELSDCIAIVVSEETGRVSIANMGAMKSIKEIEEIETEILRINQTKIRHH